MSAHCTDRPSNGSVVRRTVGAIVGVLVAVAVAVGISLTAGSPAVASVDAPSYGVSANTVAAQRTATPSAAVTGSTYVDGDVLGDWRVVFAGYGAVTADANNSNRIALAPQPVSSPGATSAALAVSTESFTAPTLRVEATMATTTQLRVNTPANAWEVPWLVWDYVDNEHFYYAVAKPNGWELGKRDPAYPGGQRFLATGSEIAVAIGETANLSVVREVQDNSSRIILEVNNSTVADFVDDERAYTGGNAGAYTEDADVIFSEVAVNGSALLNR